MRLASFLAVAVAIILIRMLPQAKSLESVLGVNSAMLSLPLILLFSLILGLRAIVNIPVNLEANWIFQLTEVRQTAALFCWIAQRDLFPEFASSASASIRPQHLSLGMEACLLSQPF